MVRDGPAPDGHPDGLTPEHEYLVFRLVKERTRGRAHEKWQEVARAHTWAEVEDLVDARDEPADEFGDRLYGPWPLNNSARIGWFVASAGDVAAHLRKDGRWRVFQQPFTGEESQDPT